ncbi:MAG: DUF885 domain-containing protein [Lachnospiraceae bacterium]|nr:DUF885 domain-containing protein [Lachnospiraceae bacterium]
MKRRLTILFCFLFIIIISSAAFFPSYQTWHTKINTQQRFTAYLDKLFADWVSADTLTLHYQLAEPSDYHIFRESVSLSNSYLKNTSDYNKELSTLHTFQKDDLNSSQQKVYHILEDYLERQKNLSKFPLYQTVFSPTTGIQAQLPVTLCEFPIHTEDDLLIYFSLLEKIPDYFQKLYEMEQEKADQGLFCSDEILDQIIKQMDSFLQNSSDNPLITSFSDHIETLNLKRHQQQKYANRNKTLILYTFLPAYKTLRNRLSKLKGSGKNPLGICYYDQGKSYYSALAASLTGSDATPSEMITMTEKNIHSLYRELEEILYLYPNAYEQFLDTDITDYIPDSESSILKWLKESLPDSFPAASDAKYVVKYVPTCLENYVSPAFYMVPSIDQFQNNTIYINKKQLPSLSSSYSVLAHEGYPGHLYQTTYFYEHLKHPVLSLCNYDGYVEGWAVYAENLSYDFLDFGSNSTIIARLYQINHILNLAIPARIDLGVHYEGWNQKNVTNFLSNLGLEKDEISREIFHTILAEPGNYLSYYIGYLEIQSFEKNYWKKTEKQKKKDSFYQLFLDSGPCDFPYLNSALNSNR